MSESLDSSLRLREFLGNHFVQWTVLFAFIANGISWILLILFIEPSEAPIFLRYNIYLGSDLSYVVPWYESYRILLFSFIFFLLNCIIAFLFFRKTDRFTSHTILLGNIFVQLFVVISVIAIVLVNL
ncbi:MAG: hypothetical protein IPN70_03505 [Candidatus Moraniibacteriota bacterium]|nr:MAG: hypothetical protein IPN70_03505 [Candidatus Moranbacteria bacterium]